MSVRWRFANKKNKVIVKRGSTFDLEGAHPSKKTSGKKTPRVSLKVVFWDPRCQLKPDTSSRWSGARAAPLPMNRRHHLHHPSRFGTENPRWEAYHGCNMYHRFINCNPRILTKATWNMLCRKVSHRRVENTCHMKRGEKPAYLSGALLGPVCLPK